jgi:hypothetical protein
LIAILHRLAVGKSKSDVGACTLRTSIENYIFGNSVEEQKRLMFQAKFLRLSMPLVEEELQTMRRILDQQE